MKINKIILAIVIAFTSKAIFAQQDAMFTHYMYNTLAVNPGYAGSRDALTVTGLHRSQWVNFDGAPQTQTITLHSPILNNKMGIGLSLVNDKIGPTKNTAAYADIAYALKVSEKGKLAFGIKAGINAVRANFSSLRLDQQNDIAFQENLKGKSLLNFGTGVYYYLPRFYVGLSTPRILQNDIEVKNSAGGTTNLFGEKRHYFLIAGTVFKLTNSIDLKPTTFFKFTRNAPMEADLTTSFIFSKKLLLGAMFRTGDALGVLVGYDIMEQLHAGYSFDWSYANKTGRYNAGSHEILLVYDFIFNNKQKVRSPRYF